MLPIINNIITSMPNQNRSISKSNTSMNTNMNTSIIDQRNAIESQYPHIYDQMKPKLCPITNRKPQMNEHETFTRAQIDWIFITEQEQQLEPNTYFIPTWSELHIQRNTSAVNRWYKMSCGEWPPMVFDFNKTLRWWCSIF